MEIDNHNPTMAPLNLTAVVGEVLENLAFMVSDDNALRPVDDTPWLECSIEYRGPVTGTLHCWCTRNFALQLTANLLGVDLADEGIHDQMKDALGEFMNVVCGQFVTTCYGVGPVFDLSIPASVECATPLLDQEGQDAMCELSVSDEPFYCLHQPGKKR